jgi:hypothetical protein
MLRLLGTARCACCFVIGHCVHTAISGEKPMKFPASCIDMRRAIRVAGIVINNLIFVPKTPVNLGAGV